MSLLPLIFSDWWEDLDRPHRLNDQHFGLSIEPRDFTRNDSPSSELLLYRPGRLRRRSERYHPFLHNLVKRSGRGLSTITPDKDSFVVTLDVQQFHPDEIKVKVVGKHIVVEAKHEEKEDEHGWISRQFVRKYLVPNQCDLDKIETHLSTDGVLKIVAPKKDQPKAENERVIKIQFTGEPAVAMDENAPAEASAQDQTQQRQVSPRGKKTVKAA